MPKHRTDREGVGRKLIAAASAILLISIMLLAYASFLGRGQSGNSSAGPAGGDQASAGLCHRLWAEAPLRATVLPSNPSIEFTLGSKRSGNTWIVSLSVTNRGSTTADLAWLANEGLTLVVYNAIGAIAATKTLRSDSVPVLNPGETLTIRASIKPTAGSPSPVYITVFNNNRMVSLSTWLLDPANITIACGAYTFRTGQASLVVRWLETRYGLVAAEAAIASKGSVVISGSSPHTFNLTIEDDTGVSVATLAGLGINGSTTLPPNSTLVLGSIATYTIGNPYKVNLTIGISVDGEKPQGYTGAFANVWGRGVSPWKTSSAVSSNGSLTLIADYAYNGYILAIRSVRLVASENTTLTLNRSFSVKLFNTPLPGAVFRVEAENLHSGAAYYAILRLGSSYGVSLVASSNGSFEYSIREGSYTLSKLVDLSGITSIKEYYTVFYAPRQASPRLLVETPWGTSTLTLSG